MQIVDAQIHLWQHNMPNNPVHRQVSAFTPDEALALMDEGGVNAAVIQPPSWEPEAIELARDAARKFPDRFAIMGLLDLDDPASQALIADWRNVPGQLGLRCILKGDAGRERVESGSLDWVWREAEKENVPITSEPNKDAAAMAHMSNLLALAKFPNVAVKATGAPGYSSEDYPYPAMHTHLRQIYDAFGPNRMFWGTDISKMSCSWGQCVTMFTEELDWLSKQDKDLIMGDALCAWWGWDRGA